MALVGNQARQETVFQREEFAQLPKSKMDLSHDVKTTCRLGQLIPFLVLETLPGDQFILSAEVMTRFETLNFPIMHRMNLKMWWFYVPNRILWPGWEGFISDTEDRAIYEHPYLSIDYVDQLTGAEDPDIFHYLGFPFLQNPLSHTPSITTYPVVINPLPAAAYLRIYWDFFANTIINDYVDFEVSAGENNNQSWWLDWEGVLFRRNWNRDYFTSATLLPFAGGVDVQVPLIDLVNSDYPTVWRQLKDQASPGNPPSGSGNLLVEGTSGESHAGSSQNVEVGLDIQATSATIRQLRLNMRMMEWLEKLNRTGNRYRDTMRGFFGSDPFAGVIDFVEYIGTMSAVVQISDVMSMAETELAAGTVPLGAYAGKALAMQGSNTMTYNCPEHGFIMGILNIQPRSSYYQGVERMWTRRDKFDYAWPQFAHVGDQEIAKREFVLPFGATTDWDSEEALETWGYIPRYSEYRYKNDLVTGQFRYLEYKDWHLAREFDTTDIPDLNQAFIECDPRSDDVFVKNEDLHECFVHIWNKVQVWRILPKYGIPMG